jgi:hypothetical protein
MWCVVWCEVWWWWGPHLVTASLGWMTAAWQYTAGGYLALFQPSFLQTSEASPDVSAC